MYEAVSRAPYGARGLKYWDQAAKAAGKVVALRMGRVD